MIHWLMFISVFLQGMKLTWRPSPPFAFVSSYVWDTCGGSPENAPGTTVISVLSHSFHAARNGITEFRDHSLTNDFTNAFFVIP